VELDYVALEKTSVIAFAHVRNEIDRLLYATHGYAPSVTTSLLSALSSRIKEEADELVIVAETYHTLHEGLTRSNINILNKPEIKEQKADE